MNRKTRQNVFKWTFWRVHMVGGEGFEPPTPCL